MEDSDCDCDWLWIWKTPRTTRPEIVKKYVYEGRRETLRSESAQVLKCCRKNVAVIHCGPHQFHQIHHHQQHQHHHRRRDVVINTLIIIAFLYHYYCCQDSVNWCPTHAIETGRGTTEEGGNGGESETWLGGSSGSWGRSGLGWRPLNLATRFGAVPGTPREPELENDRWPI